MNVGEITRIVGLCCLPLAKTESTVQRGDGPVTINVVAQPDPSPTDLDMLATRVLIDVHFFTCAVHKERAEFYREDLRRILEPQADLLQAGPSVHALAERLESEDTALMLMGLGEAMGYWKVITPGKLGLRGEEADRAAGVGYLMITPGFKEHPHGRH
jgi:hypothetical protein